MPAAPRHEAFGCGAMALHNLPEEGPAGMRGHERVETLPRVLDGPPDELARTLGVVAVPIEEPPRSLRMRARPVAQFARGFGMDLGPRSRGTGPGGGAGAGTGVGGVGAA